MRLLIITVLLCFASATVEAQAYCGDRANVAAKLEQGYAEKPVSMGLAFNGSIIEVFASPNGSFTIVMTAPNGTACLMAAGKNWENLRITTEEQGT